MGSVFFTERFASLTPYVPGEQPREREYIKLNTNESPFPPAPAVENAVKEETSRLQLYPDPESLDIRKAIAERYGVKPEQVLVGNGSDEMLYLAFLAYCDDAHPALFPDITYGFYPVFSEVSRIPYVEIPLRDDLSIDLSDYSDLNGTVFLANPNAPTGLALRPTDIEKMLQARPDRMYVVDEAYVDFGWESMLPMIESYPNLLVIQTFSKSRSMAGARLGFAVGQEELIRDLNTLKYSLNPYNVNRMTAAAGIATLHEDDYYRRNAAVISEIRDRTADAMRGLGCTVTHSVTNFLFASVPGLGGAEYTRRLKERGILVRHFPVKRIEDYVRITVGTREQMEALVRETEQILKEVRG